MSEFDGYDEEPDILVQLTPFDALEICLIFEALREDFESKPSLTAARDAAERFRQQVEEKFTISQIEDAKRTRHVYRMLNRVPPEKHGDV